MNVSDGSSVQNKSEVDEEKLWNTWGKIIKEWDKNRNKNGKQINELVRQGIPRHFRAVVWQLLTSANDAPEKELYTEYLKQAKSPYENIIRRDIARTYPAHDFFKETCGTGQRSLFNVIKAYSLHDREVGYCQGSAFVAGLLILHMPEEEAFAVLVKIMQDHNMRDLYKPNMILLELYMFQLEMLVSEHLPELHQHFLAQDFNAQMYAQSWFVALFTTTFSFEMASRIMDVFLMEGIEIIFKISLALLTLTKNKLMALNMEEMLMFFQKELSVYVDSDPEALMQYAYNIKYNAKKMKQLEKEFNVKKSKQSEESAKIDRLQAENRQLKYRCELLDKECDKLADRLVCGQVKYYKEKEANFILKSKFEDVNENYLETASILKDYKQNNLLETEDMIRCLQEELVKVRLKEAENDALLRDLKAYAHELEEDKKILRETVPDNTVAHLQEELIAVKLREAEADMSLKDLRQKLKELSVKCQQYIQRYTNETEIQMAPKRLLFWDNKKQNTQKIEEELITTKINEMQILIEVKELRLKVMELESQVQVRSNQLKRKDEEIRKMKENLESSKLKYKEASALVSDLERRYRDLENSVNDERYATRIKDAENTHAITELKQKIRQLEIKNEEIATEGVLHNFDLQAEILDLQTTKKGRLMSQMSVDSVEENWKVDDLAFQFDTTSSCNSENLSDNKYTLYYANPDESEC